MYIYVFGSLCRGEIDSNSDVDLLIISNKDKLNDFDRKELIKNIISFNGNIPIYKDPNDALPCSKDDCVFVGSTEKTSFPATVFTCPVCGTVDNS